MKNILLPKYALVIIFLISSSKGFLVTFVTSEDHRQFVSYEHCLDRF